MEVKERIAALRGEMEREGIDIWIVPSADHHQSEYVCLAQDRSRRGAVLIFCLYRKMFSVMIYKI